MEKLTISDIAKLANVSIATVSNYLNGNYNKMSAKTRSYLTEIINQTNYQPNSTARNLAKNENKTIGVSVADITNPFTSSMMSGIYEVCDEFGYKVLFTNADNNSQNEINNILRLRSENVAGFIIDPVDANSTIFKSFSNASTIMVDRQSNEPEVDTIVTDNLSSVKNMVSKMLNKSYDELYFVSWPLEGVSTRVLRYQGFLDATKYEYGSHLLIVPHHGEKHLYEEFNKNVRDIMINKGDKKIGFFCMNVRAFIRLMKAMQSGNYTYPNDYGLATYEEFDWMKLLTPGISCIQQDSKKLGEQAATNLNEKLTKQLNNAPNISIVPTKLIIRDSF